jgi:hypothetical protein
MDKISISNLIPSSEFDSISVTSLSYTRSKQLQTKLCFNVNKLVTLREEKKKKIIKVYEKIYNICLNRIDKANTKNATQIIYTFSNAIFGEPDYRKSDCIQYVEKLLKEMKLDVIMLDSNQMYISWVNLGEYLKK